MSRRALAAALLAGALLSGCQTEEIDVESSADEQGAELFAERCSGCHTLSAASSQGSKPEGQVSGGERTNGPNFDTRKETKDDVLFAIRNGGFSGAIMPANIVVGEEAEAVAEFVEKYSGRRKATGDSSTDFGQGSVGN
jgi:mono/diheme cytochrome c family protein